MKMFPSSSAYFHLRALRICHRKNSIFKAEVLLGFPGCPVTKTPWSNAGGSGFHPWSENSTKLELMLQDWAEPKKKKS